MKVNLRLFAVLHDLAGARQVSLELDDGATIDDLKAHFAATYPAVQPLIERVVCAVGDQYVSSSERVPAGAEVALIPPVSGGSGDLFRVTSEPLDARELAELVRRDEAGAIALFYGVVRNHNEGRQVERLKYEAHEPLARAKLAEVAEETKRRFPEVSEVGAWHRTGMLEIGETSLLVAVSSPHRADAFEACHWAVDRIKEVVPVWKKEHWAGGSAWLEGHAVEPPRTADAT